MVIIRLLDGTVYKNELKKIVKEPPPKRTFEERYPDYDPSVDYKIEHLDWLGERKHFCPGWAMMNGTCKSYQELMCQMYYGADASIRSNKTAFLYYRDDVYAVKKTKDKSATQRALETFGLTAKKETSYPDKWFITFNYPPDAHTKDKFVSKVETGVQRLFMKEWVLEARGCFEYYGKTKNHAHFMCVIKINQDCNPICNISKFHKVIKEASIASLIKEKNFIEFKKFEERHDEYVDLIKCEAKQDALDKDRTWRDKMGLRHHYNKTDYMKDY